MDERKPSNEQIREVFFAKFSVDLKRATDIYLQFLKGYGSYLRGQKNIPDQVKNLKQLVAEHFRILSDLQEKVKEYAAPAFVGMLKAAQAQHEAMALAALTAGGLDAER